MSKKNDASTAASSAEVQCEKALELARGLLDLLSLSKPPNELDIDPIIAEDPTFEKLYTHIMDIRALASSLNHGDLQKFVFSRGYILSNLKAMQSNLRHLTWQTQKIAEGDFSQHVDFLGDFSDSFNSMTKKLKDNSRQLHRLANFDALTQVPNRMSLDNFLAEEFRLAKETDTNLSILIFDIDHFKRVNDTYGHNAGDKVLVAIAKILNKQFRASDIFARYGGEEFMAVLPGATSDVAYRIALRSLEAIAAENIAIDDVTTVSLTVSAGVSERRAEDEVFDAIVKRSDRALYQAKRNGRNRVCSIL